jgi:hypothetical protein
MRTLHSIEYSQVAGGDNPGHGPYTPGTFFQGPGWSEPSSTNYTICLWDHCYTGNLAGQAITTPFRIGAIGSAITSAFEWLTSLFGGPSDREPTEGGDPMNGPDSGIRIPNPEEMFGGRGPRIWEF